MMSSQLPEIRAWLRSQAGVNGGLAIYLNHLRELAQSKAISVVTTQGENEYEKGEYAGIMNVVRLTESIIRSGTENDTK